MFSLASARTSHPQASKHRQFAYGHNSSQLEAHVGSPIPDTHFAHQLTVDRHKIGTFQWVPAKSHRRHNCGQPGSAYAHCTWAYLTSTVSARPPWLLLNTSQLPQAAITHSLQTPTISTVKHFFLVKKKKKKEVDES